MDRSRAVLLEPPAAQKPAPDPEDDDAPPPTVGLDVMLSLGISYRRLDYWTRRGFLETTTPGREVGSGFVRRWTVEDYQVCYLMLALVGSGVAPSSAAFYARDAVRLRALSLTTEHGVRLGLPTPPDLPREDPA